MLDDWLAAEQQVDAAVPGDAATGSRKQAGQGMGHGKLAGPRRGSGGRPRRRRGDDRGRFVRLPQGEINVYRVEMAATPELRVELRLV